MGDVLNISYSQISQYLSCPSREMYYLRGIKTPKTAALVYGSVFHKALALALKGKQYNINDLMTPYLTGNAPDEKDWNGILTFGDNDWPVEVMTSWMQDAIKLVLDMPSRPQSTELMLSRGIKMPDGLTFNLRGVVDALWNGVLIDFKLAGRFYKVDTFQAACYAILNGGPSRFKFYVVFKEKTPRLEVQLVKEVLDQSYLDWSLDRVIAPVARSIQNGIFPANPSYQFCSKHFCPYWAICKETV